MSEQEKKHYFLIYGEVIYVEKAKPDHIKAVNLNAALIVDNAYVSTSDLTDAQKTLQQGLHLRVDPESIEVKDVLIKSLSPLGQMTVNEFAGADVLAQAREAVDAAAKAAQ